MLLIAGFVVLVVAVVWAVNVLLGHGLIGLIIALVIAGVGSFVAYWNSIAHSRSNKAVLICANLYGVASRSSMI